MAIIKDTCSQNIILSHVCYAQVLLNVLVTALIAILLCLNNPSQGIRIGCRA